jgi:hypothetical protein
VQYRRDRLLSSAAEHVDVVAYERGQPGDVLVTDIEAVLAELGDGGVHVAGVEQHVMSPSWGARRSWMAVAGSSWCMTRCWASGAKDLLAAGIAFQSASVKPTRT